MKISREDLEKLFDSEKVHVTKSTHKMDELKSVRHKIKKLPAPKPKKQSLYDLYVDPLLKFTAVSCFSGLIIFGTLNWQPYLLQSKWFYRVDIKKQSFAPAAMPTPTVPQLTLPGITPTIAEKSGTYIKADKISLNAPVIWDIGEPDVLEQLKNGVIQYQGTSHPGEGGNVFMIGHSSNYFWIKSDYNAVFALLDKLESSDRIEVRYNNRSYFYDVTDKKVVSPNDIEVMQDSQKEFLTLMTCWPVGTNVSRLVIQAQLVYSEN